MLDDQNRLVVSALALDASAKRVDRRTRQGVKESFHAMHEVQMLIELLGRVVSRIALRKFEGAEPAFDPGGSRDRLRDRGRHLHLRAGLRRCACSEQQAGNDSDGQADGRAGQRFRCAFHWGYPARFAGS